MDSLLHPLRVSCRLHGVSSQVIEILLQTLDLQVATLVFVGLLSLQLHNLLVFSGDRIFADGELLLESMYLQVQYARRRLHLLRLQPCISMLFLLAQRGNSVVIFALSFHVSYLFVIASLSIMLFFLQLHECLFVLVF